MLLQLGRLAVSDNIPVARDVVGSKVWCLLLWLTTAGCVIGMLAIFTLSPWVFLPKGAARWWSGVVIQAVGALLMLLIGIAYIAVWHKGEPVDKVSLARTAVCCCSY